MRKMPKAIAAVAVGACASLMLVVPDAAAINRVGCSSYDYTWLESNQTTCWANSGTQSVSLYAVSAVAAGNNAGWVYSGGYLYFAKNSYQGWVPRTVTAVHID